MTFLLAHLSDAHIGPLPRPSTRELLGKRLTGYVNWSRRGRLQNMEVLAALVADMKAHAPDHIAMTGDILNLGLAAEFPLAATWIRTLGSPHDVSFVPGNHDAYVRSSMGPLAQTFVPWLADLGIDGSRSLLPAFPYLRRRGDVALVGLSSARPTAPFLASGALGSEQRRAIGPVLSEAGRQGLVRVVMIHHPPYRSGASTGRGLRDARAFKQIVQTHGAELIIHGHNHRAMLAHMEGPSGTIPVVGVPSASAIPGSPNHRAAYHLFRITQVGASWVIKASRRGLLPDLSGIGDLGDIDLEAGGADPVGI